MIYFIRQNDEVKIGYTESDPKGRLSQIQVGNPFDLTMILLIDGDVKVEKELHERFTDLHIRGEWFKFEEPIKEFIERWYDNDIRYQYGLSDPDIDPKMQLKLLRTNAGLRLRHVAEKLSITPQSVHETEMRELHGTVSLNSLITYCEALGYELQYKFVKKP